MLPSGFSSRIESIETADGPQPEAYPPMSVVVRLVDDLDISRGDMLCRPHNQPSVGQDVSAMVCWMAEAPLGPAPSSPSSTRPGGACAREGPPVPPRRQHPPPGPGLSELGLNDIGRINMRTTVPLFFDEYRSNRGTGSFILVDESSNATVGAGMILRASS